MKSLLVACSLMAVVLGHREQDFQRWAKHKAMESCFGAENTKLWTVRMKKAVAKCSQQDAPELLLPLYRAPYKTVNALLQASDDMEQMDMQVMFNMFKFMHQMHQSQNQDSNNFNQFRPYSHEHEHEHDNMPMPMKWMMKMMMMKKMKHAHEQDHYNNMDRQPHFQAIQNNNANYKKQGMFGNLFENIDSDMDFRDMFSSFSHSHPHRHSRALGKDLDLGDRLVEKLQAQKLEMEEKVGNLTCVLKEMNVLNAKNEISAFAMKKDLEQYNLPSVWFKENQEALIDTCYEMATTLPAEMEEGYIVEGEFGKVNMAQVKMFMHCCHKGKAKLCINQDIKLKIQENFGPVDEILKQSGLTENQLFPLVQDLLHGQASDFENFF